MTFALLTIVRSADAQETKKQRVAQCIESFEDAQVRQRKGELTAAMSAYRACSASACPAEIRTDCSRALDVVEKSVPTVTLVIRDQNGKDHDGLIKVDGKLIEIQRGRATPLDPGDHVLRFSVDGSEYRQIVTAHEGEKSRLVVLSMAPSNVAPPEPKPKPKPKQDDEPKPSRVVVERESESESESTGGVPYWVPPVALGVVSIVAISIGVGNYLSYAIDESRLLDQFNAAKAGCGGDCVTGTREADAANDAKSRFERNEREIEAKTPAILGLTIGGTLGLVGAIVWFVVAKPAPKASSSSSASSITPQVGLDRAGLRFTF